MKLREIEGQPAQLIWYVRPDEQAPKASDYLVVPVADAPLLKSALTAAFGVGGVVDKRREIFLWHNVRIHLDEVESTFEGDLDLHGFLGMDPKVRNGYQQIRVTFKIKGDASEEKLQELVEISQQRSPVFDIVTHGVPVKVTLAK